MGLGDLRAIGSGNIGATNVMRTGNKAAGVATFALDARKGAIAALLAGWLIAPDAGQAAALAAFIGHLYPVYIGFRAARAWRPSSASRWRWHGPWGWPLAPHGS